MPCRSEIPIAFAHGTIGLLAQIMMALALRYERAVTFAVCRSFQIVFVFLFQVGLIHFNTIQFVFILFLNILFTVCRSFQIVFVFTISSKLLM